MNDVDERIRSAIKALAEQLPVRDADLAMAPQPTKVRRLRRCVYAMSAAAAVAAIVLVFASTREPSRSVRTVDQGSQGCPQGDIYLVGGNSNTSAVLYRGSLCPLRLDPVPGVTRARGVSGNADLVVVTYEAGGMAKVVDGKTEPLPGLDLEHINDASVSPEGLVAVTTSQPITGGAVTDRLHVYDPKTRTTRPLLADNRFLSHPTWGPDGTIAVYRAGGQNGQKPQITIVEPDGTSRHVPIRPPAMPALVDHLLWGPTDSIALSYLDAGLEPVTVLIDPGTGKQKIFRGWWAVAWSPDGTSLLVQSLEKSDLAVVRAPDFGRPRSIGSTSFHIFGAEWLPCTVASSCADAQNTRPPAKEERRIELEFSEFRRLAREGRILSADVYERRNVIRGRYVSDESAEASYSSPIPPSTNMDELIATLLGDGVSVNLQGS